MCSIDAWQCNLCFRRYLCSRFRDRSSELCRRADDRSGFLWGTGGQTEVQEGTPVAEETEAPATDTQQTEAHTEAATEAHTETAAETQAAETTAEQQVQKEASEETKVSEEVQLTQDMKNAEGKTICKVIADLPEGAFNADASEITMEFE